MEQPPVEKSQTRETVTTDREQSYRPNPSLPNRDKCSKTEGCVPRREKLPAAAVYHPDAQSEASAARSHVRTTAQILTLEGQRQELLSINKKWATEYRSMNRYYAEKVKGLKALLRHDPCLCEGGDDVTLDGRGKEKEGTKNVSPELLKAEKEAKDLRAQNSTLTRRWQRQREEIRRLNAALEEALRTARPPDVSRETLQEVWKHQAQVYKEDFLRERRDREKLQEKNLQLEETLRKVHSESRVVQPLVITDES